MRRVYFCLLLTLLFSPLTLLAGTIVEQVVARVGNEIITKSDVEQEQKRLYDEMSRRLQGEELETRYAEQKKNLLDFMINQKLLEQRARELDLNVEEEISAAIKRLREENNIPDDETLEEALRKEGSSMAQLREDFRRRIIQQRVLWNYVQSKVNITEDEIRKYYEEHKQEMVNEPRTKIRRYEFAGENVEKGILNAEARSLVNALRSGQTIEPANFPHLKPEESLEVTKQELDAKFAQMLEATKVGEATDPIETEKGWIVLKVEERQEPKNVSFDEARGRIYNTLLQQRAEKYQKTFFEDLRKQSYVAILNPIS